MSVTVTLPYDPVWTALAWAKEHCPSYITNKSINTTSLRREPGGWASDSSIVYYFNDEQDAVLFKLTWS